MSHSTGSKSSFTILFVGGEQRVLSCSVYFSDFDNWWRNEGKVPPIPISHGSRANCTDAFGIDLILMWFQSPNANPNRDDGHILHSRQCVCRGLQLDPMFIDGFKSSKVCRHFVYLWGVLYGLASSRKVLCIDLNTIKARAFERPRVLGDDDKTGATMGCLGVSNDLIDVNLVTNGLSNIVLGERNIAGSTPLSGNLLKGAEISSKHYHFKVEYHTSQASVSLSK
ncbi:unnamed protein product [Malus baccata var. baccata]